MSGEVDQAAALRFAGRSLAGNWLREGAAECVLVGEMLLSAPGPGRRTDLNLAAAAALAAAREAAAAEAELGASPSAVISSSHITSARAAADALEEEIGFAEGGGETTETTDCCRRAKEKLEMAVIRFQQAEKRAG